MALALSRLMARSDFLVLSHVMAAHYGWYSHLEMARSSLMALTHPHLARSLGLVLSEIMARSSIMVHSFALASLALYGPLGSLGSLYSLGSLIPHGALTRFWSSRLHWFQTLYLLRR